MTLDTLAEAIQKDLKDIRERMVIKEDLVGFATKDDLARFATKDDLAQFATKDDLARFATKDEVWKELERFATKEDVEEVRDYVVSKNRSDLHEVKTELLAEINKYHYAREIDDLRGRVVRVEKKVGLYVESEVELDAE